MGTIAEKLTYLNTTKEKIRDSINLTGANLTSEDTFRSYASKLKKGYIDIINNGIDTLYNNFPKVSGIGSNLSLTPTYEAPIKLNEIQGSTLQNGTPTPDTPVEIQSVTGLQNIEVCGKNLLNIPNGTYSNNGITAVTSNGTITLNGTASNTSFIRLNVGLNLVSGTYTLSLNNSNTKSDTGTYVRFDSDPNSILTYENTNASNNITLSEDKTYSRLVIRTTSGITFENFIIKPQLEQGSTATTYEPYKDNTYEVNLGKNLFDKNDITTGLYYYASGTNISVNWAIAQVKVQPNTNYYLSGNNYNNDTARIVLLDSSKNITHDLGGYKNVHLITTNSNTAYIGLSIANYEGSSDLSSIQLEKGSQATSYSPYFTPIELNKIGDYKDSIKKSTGKNLFDGVVAQGEFNILGNINTTTIRNYSVNYIPVIPNENYVSNYNINRMCFYDKNKTFINRSSNYNFATFTIPSNAYYIRFDISTDYNASTMQIEKGSTATTYEPYGKVWYVEKNIGKVVLDGSEEWTKRNDGDGSTTITFNHNMTLGAYGSNSEYCNKFIYVQESASGNEGIGIGSYLNQIYIQIKRSRLSSLDVTGFKTWLSTHNTEVLYVLATPTYTEITNTELIEDLETLYTAKSQEGTTNISITSEDLEMILNVSALKGDA